MGREGARGGRGALAGRPLAARAVPRTPPEIAGYEVTGSCLPAHEVGGDFYDWYAVGDALQLVLGDVMGKGLPAAESNADWHHKNKLTDSELEDIRVAVGDF